MLVIVELANAAGVTVVGILGMTTRGFADIFAARRTVQIIAFVLAALDARFDVRAY